MFDLKQTILDQTQYVSGYNNETDAYVISASMIGKEAMQNYLSIVHGKIPDTEINDATLGSIFHKGLEVMVLDKTRKENITDVYVEHSMSMELSNGWILSGTADLVARTPTDIIQIRDYKLTKAYKLKMMLKNLATDEYTHQLQTLDMLFRQNNAAETELICDLFIKDAKAVNYESTHNPVVVPKAQPKEILDGNGGTMIITADAELTANIVLQTNQLQQFIESGEVPDECSDKWIRVVKGNTIPTKCAFYCSHGKAGLCPYYNPTTRQSVNRLVGW